MQNIIERINRKIRRTLKPEPKKTLSFEKLHLGCGHIHLDGWTNVDASPLPTVDLVSDIRDLNQVPDGSAREIYACHVLEHFGHNEIVPILKKWLSKLQPGGTLRISVPDLDKIVRIYVDNWQHFQTKGNSPWVGLIYGGQGDQYDFHKTGFNFCWLSLQLEQAGFTDIKEYPIEPHFIPGANDASLANQPFNRYLSLNVMAKRPHTVQ